MLEKQIYTFFGLQLIIAGQKWLDRHHGKDRNVTSKEKQKEIKNTTSVSKNLLQRFAFGNAMSLLSIVDFLLVSVVKN